MNLKAGEGRGVMYTRVCVRAHNTHRIRVNRREMADSIGQLDTCRCMSSCRSSRLRSYRMPDDRSADRTKGDELS